MSNMVTKAGTVLICTALEKLLDALYSTLDI